MQQLSPDDSSSEASGSIVRLDFDKLYEDYQKSIERYMRRQGHDQESARDFCQDTFVHFLNYLSHHETDLPQSEKHMRNVLFRIAENIKIDDYRKKHIDYQPLTESDAYTQIDEMWIDDKLLLQEELPLMSAQQRKCLLLKYYYGYTQKKIAAIVGISEAAVSMNVSRGKTYLRRMKYFTVPSGFIRKLSDREITNLYQYHVEMLPPGEPLLTAVFLAIDHYCKLVHLPNPPSWEDS
jgi:RNA polymerase sigma-70 factor (ECF subfamily)